MSIIMFLSFFIPFLFSQSLTSLSKIVLNFRLFENLDSVNTSVQNTKDNVKELSKIGANTVKTF
jgi:hypothetical protein